MTELLNSLSENNLVLLCVIMGVIALFLAIAISIEIYNNNKKVNKLIYKDTDNESNDDEIKYEIEDEELERTKAQIELACLREKLKKEEEKKARLLNQSLSKTYEDDSKIVETSSVELKNTDEKIEEKEVNNTSQKEIVTIEIKKNHDEDFDDEKDAIISYDELKNSTNFGYTDDEMNMYVDEEDAIISIDELEKLYKESEQIETIQFEVKHVDDLPEISSEKKFQSTPVISPVYGLTETDSELLLEQTANLEKLNEEIRKTNEFLKTLKDLKKNLD